MKRIEDLFSESYKPGYYKLIDNSHPLSLYIGVDDEGNYAIEYRGRFDIIPVKDSSAIKVTHTIEKGYKSIIFSLKEASMLSIFCAFCEDMINSTRECADNDKGYNLLINRFYSWKRMFHQGRGKLEEKNIMGLIGEIIFLKDFLFPLYGEDVSLNSWTGSERTHKDFSIDSTWYEIKSISFGKNSIIINSFEQLDSNIDGHLCVYELEKMSPEFAGITLNKLVREVYTLLKFDSQKDIFLQKLSDADYSYNKEYDKFVYEIKNRQLYLVSEKFPCLHRTPSMDAISNIHYEILLPKIEPFKES